jgi:hypothetical protein
MGQTAAALYFVILQIVFLLLIHNINLQKILYSLHSYTCLNESMFIGFSLILIHTPAFLLPIINTILGENSPIKLRTFFILLKTFYTFFLYKFRSVKIILF